MFQTFSLVPPPNQTPIHVPPATLISHQSTLHTPSPNERHEGVALALT